MIDARGGLARYLVEASRRQQTRFLPPLKNWQVHMLGSHGEASATIMGSPEMVPKHRRATSNMDHARPNRPASYAKCAEVNGRRGHVLHDDIEPTTLTLPLFPSKQRERLARQLFFFCVGKCMHRNPTPRAATALAN